MRTTKLRCTTAIVVATREMYEQFCNPLAWFLLLIAAGLSAFATHVGIERVRIDQAQHSALLEQREQDRIRNSGRLFGNQIETGLRAIRSPEPVSVLVAGVDPVLPQFWDFSPSGVRTGRVPGEVGNERVGALGNIDLEFLIRVILGLLAISIAVESIAGERATGALLALLGQPVRPREVLAGKLLGGMATLAIAVLGAGFVALATTMIGEPALVSWEFALTLLAICLAGGLYTFICFTAGVLISIVVSGYRLALTASFVGWTLAALIAFPATAIVARSIFPVPPRPIVEAQREQLTHAATLDVQNRMGDTYVAVMGGRTDWASHQQNEALTREAQARAEPLWRDHTRAMRSKLDGMSSVMAAMTRKQQRAAWILSLVSPAAEFSAAVTNLAGTGDRIAHRWDTATTAYQALLDRELFDNRPGLLALAPYVSNREPGRERRLTVPLDQRPAPFVSHLTVFGAPERDFTQRLRDASPHLLMLTLYAFGLVCASVVAFDRMRV